MNIKKLLLIFAMCLIAALSFGQRRGGFMRNGFPGQPFSLLNRPDVKTDLALTPEQKAKLDGINDDYGSQFRDAFQNSNGDRAAGMKAVQELAQKEYAEEGKVLTPDQITRLSQIGVQLWGYNALLNKDLQTQLALTDAQKAKIEDLNKQMQAANQAIMQKAFNQEMTFQEARPLMDKNTEALKTSISDLLTADQKTKFDGLSGKKFTPDPEPAPGGGG